MGRVGELRFFAPVVGIIVLTHLAAAQVPQDSSARQGATPASATDSDKKPPSVAKTASPIPDSTKLEPIKTEKAVYPLEAEQKELQGQVWVKIRVSETGDVVSAEAISGDPVFVNSALDAVKKWRFKPFIKNGVPIAVVTKLPFSFAFTGNVHQETLPPAPEISPAGTATPSANAAPQDATTAAPSRAPVSSGVIAGLLIYKVNPVYPPEARRAGIQGTVILQAYISKEGRITDLQLISGPKELAEAAKGAVEQWRYRPYLLKGEPVAVKTQIQVNFVLSRH